MEQAKRVASLERHLERAKMEMEELKKTHKQELEAKLKELRNDLHNVAKERQEFLKAEVKRQRRKAEENLLACWSKDTELSKEQKRRTELQRKVEELNAEIKAQARNSAAASREKEDTAPTILPRVSRITIEELKKQIFAKDKENQMLKASLMEQKEKTTSLEHHLQRAKNEMEEVKKTHKQELEAKLKELRNDLHNVAKERQEFLKAEVKRQRRKAEENLLACWSKDTELSKEQKRRTELQRKVEELNAEIKAQARNSNAASREKEDTASSVVPRVSRITIEGLKKQILDMGDMIESKDKENQMQEAFSMELTKMVTSLEHHLQRAKNEMEEVKKTHKQELEAKLKEPRNELHNVAKEHQEFPQAEIVRWHTIQFAKANNFVEAAREKEDTAPTVVPRVSRITGVDEPWEERPPEEELTSL